MILLLNITPENTDQRQPAILHRETVNGVTSHWEGEEGPGVSPIRGQEMSELFDASIIAAQAGAREEQIYQGPSPDRMIAKSLSNLQSLATSH